MFWDDRPFFVKLRVNAFFLLLGVYAIILVLWYAYNGVLFQFSLGFAALALLPVTFILGRSTQFIRELTPFLVLLLSYEALQGVAGSLALVPVIHATAPPGATGGKGFLEVLQSDFLSPDFTDVMTFLYGLHFPLVMISAVLFWYSNRTIYKRYVYSLVACSYVSLLFYVIAPSAPPWYTGVVTNLLANTSAQPSVSGIFSEMARIGSLIESDKLAAFPSLHAAYAVLFGFFMTRLKRTYGLVSLPITGGILFSTIYLGQHYITDLVGGVAVAVACAFVMTQAIERAHAPQAGGFDS